MTDLFGLSKEELQKHYSSYLDEYENYKARGLKLDMSRGKPAPVQTELSGDILTAATDVKKLIAEDGTDCRNYGGVGGIKAAGELFSQLIDVPADNIYIGGVSSLNLMFDTISRAMLFGLAGSDKPWSKYDRIKFITPVPGYDRHLAICEYFGIEMLPVPFTGKGPDMDIVEKLVAEDDSIKGMWCVPVYSNPTGDIYSDETIKRLASMPAKAKDFTVFYDNAYAVHTLDGNFIKPVSFFDECIKAGNPERPFIFASFSKITFAGGSMSCVACGTESMKLAKKSFGVQVLTHDKINQLRHTRVFPDADAVKQRMLQHAAIVAPKFNIVETTFSDKLGEYGVAHWSEPKGGYFISLFLDIASAKRVFQLCDNAGVKLTDAGAGYPYSKDPKDSFLRIAPTYPATEELKTAAELLCVCIMLASCEKLLGI